MYALLARRLRQKNGFAATQDPLDWPPELIALQVPASWEFLAKCPNRTQKSYLGTSWRQPNGLAYQASPRKGGQCKRWALKIRTGS
ncbi:hypothetical protein GCM10023334_125930 [Nonomuraea thailandensis]